MSPVCLSDEALSAYNRGTLVGPEWEAVATHLRSCASCLARLDGLPTDDPILAALRQTRTAPIDSAYTRAVARLAAERRLIVGPDTVLREYRVLEPLGQGGMGAVYKARHTRLDRVVALKVLRTDRCDQAAFERFAREMRAAGRLQHPNLVQATDAGEIDGVPFLVMEFVPGSDLAKWVRRHGPLRPADACEVVRQAALGLAHAHAAGLIHRDVKPSNLMLTPTGQIKVLDLGLAKLHDAQETEVPVKSGDPSTQDGTSALTGTNQALGTRDYMAPEQRQSPHSVDARADVFALGCTLLHLLSGAAPRPDLVGRVPGISPAILRRLISSDPAERYATASEAAAALAGPARGSNLAALASGPTSASDRWRRRWILAASLPVMALTVLAIYVRRPPPPWEGPADAPSSSPPRVTVPLAPDEARALQERWAAHLQQPVAETNSLGMHMMLIPPGELPTDSGGRPIAISAFRLSDHEATVGEFRAFVQATKFKTSAEKGLGGMTMHTGTPAPDPSATWDKPGSPSSDRHPVTQISYADAAAFCDWLSKVEGRRYRLPTAKEWRWACKAGSHARYFFGDDASQLTDYAWTRDNARSGPQPVGRLKPNAWGLFDMLGNVREWTSETGGPPGRTFRLAAGGSTTSDPRQHTVSGLGGFEEWVASSGLGFRVACDLSTEKSDR